MRRAFIIAAMTVTAWSAAADETTGRVVAYDRVDNVVVLADKTIWEVDGVEMPENLVAGDRIRIVYVSAGDSGVGKIESIERIAE